MSDHDQPHAKPVRVPIEAQITKYSRMFDDRAGHYRRALAKGLMSEAEWQQNMAEIIAIRSTLEWVRDNRDGIVRGVADAKRIARLKTEHESELAEMEALDAEAAALAAQARAAGASVRITETSNSEVSP